MWLFGKKKKKSDDEQWAEIISYEINNAQDEEAKRYYEALADKQYQSDLAAFYNLIAEIKETYTVLNNVGSFSSEAGDKLIERCVEAINLDNSIKSKRDYYDSNKYEYCEPYKILAMVYEKRNEFHHAATVCVFSVHQGYPKDGTNGGMRGRLARMIKKGNLPLTDDYKKILNL